MCTACGCSHDEIKRDASRWAALPLIGFQIVPEDETGPAERYEVKNALCGSTLLVQVAS